jgi:hypothetical protein
MVDRHLTVFIGPAQFNKPRARGRVGRCYTKHLPKTMSSQPGSTFYGERRHSVSGKQVRCIGRYSLTGKTLGKGNFARVELATHIITNAKVYVTSLIGKAIHYANEDCNSRLQSSSLKLRKSKRSM